MGRRDSVSQFASKLALMVMLGVGLLLDCPAPALANEELVLIVSAQSNLDQLDSSLVRKLFLGLTVSQHGDRLRPLLNESDAKIKDLFLQNIVSMSDSTYDRYVLRLSLLQGRQQPVVYKDKNSLIHAVAADPSVVSYVWAKDVANNAQIRIVRVIWHD